MKHLKKLLPVAALVFAVIGSFAMRSDNSDDPSWRYVSGSETNPNNYVVGNPGCSGSDNICKILARQDPSNPGHPQISPALATRIQNRDVSQGDVFLKK